MIAPWRAWRSTVAIWAPAVALCVASVAVYAWQTSGTVGRAAKLRGDMADVKAEVARLEHIKEQAAGEHAQVVTLNRQFDRLYSDVFGSLDERLTPILRTVGDATRQAGLRPEGYSYNAETDRRLSYTRFEIQFNVRGEYAQLRRLLAELTTSPQFLMVSYIGIAGEQEAITSQLEMSIRVATYVAEADEDTLHRLTGGIVSPEEKNDAPAQG